MLTISLPGNQSGTRLDSDSAASQATREACCWRICYGEPLCMACATGGNDGGTSGSRAYSVFCCVEVGGSFAMN
eukprot:675805-Rhodomonas_salina.1